VVVAQLAEWSLPTLEIRRSNPVNSKTLFDCLPTEIKVRQKNEKEAGNGPFKKKIN